MSSGHSPFSPFIRRRRIPAMVELSERDRSEDAEDERNAERKAQLLPRHVSNKESDGEASRKSRSRGRSRRSKDRSRGRSKDKKEKKNSSKEDKRERDRSRDRRGREAPPEPEGKPPPKTEGRTDKSPSKGNKGQGKKGNQKQIKCEICDTKISAHPAAIEQHQWLNEYCLSWQAFNRMTETQRQKKEAWAKAQEVAAKVKASRQAPSASAPRERVSVQWDSHWEGSQARSARSPHWSRPRDPTEEPRREKKRRKASSSHGSRSRSVTRKKGHRHNVVINFR